MSESIFLGIDLGTSSVVSALVDLDENVLGVATEGYSLQFPRTGWVEQNPDDWWSAVVKTIHKLGAGHDLRAVGSISISSQAPTLLALDAAMKPVRPAIIWMDRRATPQAEALGAGYPGHAYFAARGNRADPFFLAPKIAWMRTFEPDLFSRTAVFAQINGYINFQLSGVMTMDEQHASLLALRPAGATTWDETALEEIGIKSDHLPPVQRATEVIGSVSSRASALTGLRAGIPIVAGTVDGAAAGIETGVYREGSAGEMAGSSSVILMPGKAPTSHPAFITMSSPDGESWYQLAATVASGASLKWLKGLLAPDIDYGEFIAQAGDSPAGAEGVLFVPHMAGERSPLWDTQRRGSLTGLTLGVDSATLVRSVLEGTAYSLRHNLQIAQELGIFPSELRVTGSPTLSDLWCQIKADITGIPIARMKSPTGAAFGDAVLAAVGVGAVSSFEDFGAGKDRIDRYFEPTSDLALTQLYDEGFAAYLGCIHATDPGRLRVSHD